MKSGNVTLHRDSFEGKYFYEGKGLTLFRPGGGAIVPALTLDVYNFFHKQAKLTKLGDFS